MIATTAITTRTMLARAVSLEPAPTPMLSTAIAGHPELLGYVELNPHQLEASCEQMDRYYALPNFVGCELELSHTVQPTGSPEVRELMAEIAKRGKPVLFMPVLRAGAGSPRRSERYRRPRAMAAGRGRGTRPPGSPLRVTPIRHLGVTTRGLRRHHDP